MNKPIGNFEEITPWLAATQNPEQAPEKGQPHIAQAEESYEHLNPVPMAGMHHKPEKDPEKHQPPKSPSKSKKNFDTYLQAGGALAVAGFIAFLIAQVFKQMDDACTDAYNHAESAMTYAQSLLISADPKTVCLIEEQLTADLSRDIEKVAKGGCNAQDIQDHTSRKSEIILRRIHEVCHQSTPALQSKPTPITPNIQPSPEIPKPQTSPIVPKAKPSPAEPEQAFKIPANAAEGHNEGELM